MSASNFAEMQWVDIVPPEATTTSLDVAMVALAAIAIVTVAVYFYLSRPRQRARRNILALVRQTSLLDEQRRDACHLIAKELGKAFGVTHLSTLRFRSEQQKNWDAFLQHLDNNRFAPRAPSPDDLTQLAVEAVSWLRVR